MDQWAVSNYNNLGMKGKIGWVEVMVMHVRVPKEKCYFHMCVSLSDSEGTVLCAEMAYFHTCVEGT